MSEYVVKIGKKGEIYPPKKLRLEVGLVPGSELIARVKGEEIQLRKKKIISTLLEGKGIATLKPVEIRAVRDRLEEELLEG